MATPSAIADRSSPRGLRVLIVESDPIIAELYVDAIRTGLRDARIDVGGLDDPALVAALPAADVAVCPGGLSDGGLLDSLSRLLLLRPELPVVVLLAACESAAGVPRAVEQGAADVLIRTHGYLNQLPATVQRVAMHARGLGFAEARHQALRQSLDGIRAENRTLHQLIERLESMAMSDSLTGLLNRRAMDIALTRTFAGSSRYGHELSCMVIDADGFKGVNDALGHARGDEVLKLIARAIIAECRTSDIAGRLGGDEFIVLLPHTAPKEAAAVAHRIRARFARDSRELCAGSACAGDLSLTIGVAGRIAAASLSAEALLAAADEALYAGKRDGRDCVIVATSAIPPSVAETAWSARAA